MQKIHTHSNWDKKTEKVPLGNGQYYLFQTRKRSQKLLKFIVKGHGYTLKTSIFAIFQKSAKKGGGEGHCPM